MENTIFFRWSDLCVHNFCHPIFRSRSWRMAFEWQRRTFSKTLTDGWLLWSSGSSGSSRSSGPSWSSWSSCSSCSSCMAFEWHRRTFSKTLTDGWVSVKGKKLSTWDSRWEEAGTADWKLMKWKKGRSLSLFPQRSSWSWDHVSEMAKVLIFDWHDYWSKSR